MYIPAVTQYSWLYFAYCYSTISTITFEIVVTTIVINEKAAELKIFNSAAIF